MAGSQVSYDGTWRDASPIETKRLVREKTPHTYRFRTPKHKLVSLDDKVRGRIEWDVQATIGDFILLRSSGIPVYNFCVAVDDALMGVTMVVRAEEHLTNTVRQLLVLEALGFEEPSYAHASLILGSDKSKLSKRHGATSCSQFRERGYLPDAMVNYLALLGWNDGTKKSTPAKSSLRPSIFRG
jgi:glutamyl-tRNA synthetase